MFRKLSKKLENWKIRERRHPLILRGARQVGKTYLVREFDYIVQSGTRIVPIEVKGGTTGSLKGLHVFLAEKKCDFAVRFNADKPSFLPDAHAKDALGRTCDYRFLSLPLYMVCQLGRHIGDALTESCPTVRPH